MWSLVREEHTDSPASLRLEEELHYIALGDEEERAEAIDLALRPALRTLSGFDDDALMSLATRRGTRLLAAAIEDERGLHWREMPASKKRPKRQESA